MTKTICHIVAKGQVPSIHDKNRAAALTGVGTAEHRVFEVADLALCSGSISLHNCAMSLFDDVYENAA